MKPQPSLLWLGVVARFGYSAGAGAALEVGAGAGAGAGGANGLGILVGRPGMFGN